MTRGDQLKVDDVFSFVLKMLARRADDGYLEINDHDIYQMVSREHHNDCQSRSKPARSADAEQLSAAVLERLLDCEVFAPYPHHTRAGRISRERLAKLLANERMKELREFGEADW